MRQDTSTGTLKNKKAEGFLKTVVGTSCTVVTLSNVCVRCCTRYLCTRWRNTTTVNFGVKTVVQSFAEIRQRRRDGSRERRS